MPSTKIGRLSLIGIIVAVIALGATAAVSLRTSQAKDSTIGQSNYARTNRTLRVAAQDIPLDPQTGQVRPLTQEEAQRMAEGIKQLVNQSTDGLQSVRHADGSVSVDLQGRFQNLAVLKRNNNGTLTEACVDNPKAAAVFFEIDPQLVGTQKDPTSPKADSPVPVKGNDQ
jgi:negative regulator of replication initiation